MTAQDYENIQRMINHSIAHYAGNTEITEGDLALQSDLEILERDLENASNDDNGVGHRVAQLHDQLKDLEYRLDNDYFFE